MESILTSIKKLVGITEEDEIFDTDVIIFINAAFSTLNQIGAGPGNGFSISDDTTTWSEYVDDDVLLGMVKEYMYIKVKLIFDPPTNSTIYAAFERRAVELEERIKTRVENEANEQIEDNLQ